MFLHTECNRIDTTQDHKGIKRQVYALVSFMSLKFIDCHLFVEA